MIAIFSFLFAVGMSAQTFFSEDFADAIPGDWTNVEVAGDGSATAVWFHTTSGPSGPFQIDPIVSTSADNGWMLFDSDLNCSGEQNAWLISPEIDATDKDEVWMVFESFYRKYNCEPRVRVGSDLNDLDNWETFVLFPNAVNNEWAPVNDPDLNPQTITLNITDAAANSTFHFAFQFLSDGTTGTGGSGPGCGYSWQVDDVILTDESPLPAVDLGITDFFAIAPNAFTPASQVIPFGFVNDIGNYGSGTVNSSSIAVEIADATGTVFTDSHDYGSIAPGEFIFDIFFDNEFTPDATPGAAYQGTYTLTPDDGADGIPDDNVSSFVFGVSDSLYSKETGYTNATSSIENNYSWGNIYYVPNGAGMYARYVTFGVFDPDGELAGKSCNIFLYEWEGDTNGDLTMNTSEMTGAGPISFNSYEFTGNESLEELTLPIDIDAEAIELQDGKYYVIAIQYIAEADEYMSLLYSDEFDYRAANFYADSMNTIDNTIPVTYASALDPGNSGEYFAYSFGNGYNYAPLVRMSIGNNDNMFGPAITSTRETILADGTVGVFPNPVDKVANVEFNLNEMSENVRIDIFDLTGRLVSRTKHQNVQNQTLNVDVANLPAGSYKLKATTDAGTKAVNLSIQR